MFSESDQTNNDIAELTQRMRDLQMILERLNKRNGINIPSRRRKKTMLSSGTLQSAEKLLGEIFAGSRPVSRPTFPTRQPEQTIGGFGVSTDGGLRLSKAQIWAQLAVSISRALRRGN